MGAWLDRVVDGGNERRGFEWVTAGARKSWEDGSGHDHDHPGSARQRHRGTARASWGDVALRTRELAVEEERWAIRHRHDYGYRTTLPDLVAWAPGSDKALALICEETADAMTARPGCSRDGTTRSRPAATGSFSTTASTSRWRTGSRLGKKIHFTRPELHATSAVGGDLHAPSRGGASQAEQEPAAEAESPGPALRLVEPTAAAVAKRREGAGPTLSRRRTRAAPWRASTPPEEATSASAANQRDSRHRGEAKATLASLAAYARTAAAPAAPTFEFSSAVWRSEPGRPWVVLTS